MKATERALRALAQSANHCARYGAVEEFEDELEAYDTSNGTIRFQPDNPIPATLARKLVTARIAKNTARQRHAAAGASRRR